MEKEEGDVRYSREDNGKTFCGERSEIVEESKAV